MGYMVSEDLVGASSIKVHEENCHTVTNRKDNPETMKWHGPIGLDEAKDMAESLSKNYNKGWKSAECCVAKSR